MNQKGIAPLIIVAIVVVVAVAAGVGIYVATRGEGGGAGGEGVAGATSLDFKVDGRWGDASGTLRFRGKTLGLPTSR
jgi:archaellin